MAAHDPSVWDEIDELLGRYDAAVRFECASECAWSGEMRLTLTNPDRAPSRSIAFFQVGAADPDDAARELLADVARWLEESGTEPLPVPDWMKED